MYMDSIKGILTGMLWILKSDLTPQQESFIKKMYTHSNPNNPEEPFCTYLELHGKIGVPYGDKEKIAKVLPKLEIQDKRISPKFSSIKSSRLALRDYQEDAMEEIQDYLNNGGTEFNLSGFPGCISGDTEYLSPIGWKRIDEYISGKIASYQDGGIVFVEPSNYIDVPCENWIELKSGNKTLSKVSDEHRIVYKTNKGNIQEKYAYDLYTSQVAIKLITNFSGNNLQGIPISNDLLRLQVAISTDSTCLPQEYKYTFKLKKERKINRLLYLLDKCSIEYNNTLCDNGYTCITFYCHGILKGLQYLWGANTEQLSIISKEVLLWDGYKNLFFTANKEEADFVQYAFLSTGYNSNISTLDRDGKEYRRKSVEYAVRVSRDKSVSLVFKDYKGRRRRDKCTRYTAESTDRKYCFTVPSGMFLIRYNGVVHVTGNSGKTFMLANVLTKLNTKVLIIANQKMLINQISEELEAVLGEKPNILSSKNTKIADINVATSQFISQNADVWYSIKEHIGLLVLDEAEALASPTVMKIFQRAPAKYRIMISATFTRSVDHRTGALLDFAGSKRIVLHNNKLLTPTIINVLCDETFYPPMNTNQYSKAKSKFFTKDSITHKVLQIVKYSTSKNRQVLVACDLIAKQEELSTLFNSLGIPSACLNGKTKEVDRKKILEEFDTGNIKVLLGLGVLNAGISVPKISTIIRLSTPSSEEKLEQLIGRGRRDFDGKEGCFVIDLWFKGFKNKKRLQLYSLKERIENWKVHTVQWDKFFEKYLK